MGRKNPARGPGYVARPVALVRRGPVDLMTNTLTCAGSALAVQRFSGVISGSGQFVQAGPFNNTVLLTGTNTYTGVTRVLSGTLVAGADAALGDLAGNTIISAAVRPLSEIARPVPA